LAVGHPISSVVTIPNVIRAVAARLRTMSRKTKRLLQTDDFDIANVGTVQEERIYRIKN
jgi:hypothetical protein